MSFLKFRMAFTLTKYSETSSSRDRDFPFTVRNDLTSQHHASVSRGRIYSDNMLVYLGVGSAQTTCWCISGSDLLRQHVSVSRGRICSDNMLVYLRDGSALTTCWCISGTDLLRQHAGVSRGRICSDNTLVYLAVGSTQTTC